jgi:hypothetical protein
VTSELGRVGSFELVDAPPEVLQLVDAGVGARPGVAEETGHMRVGRLVMSGIANFVAKWAGTRRM